MSLQIVQNQQLKPIGDKVAIDTQLSTTSENAISNKVVTEEINQINSDLSNKIHNVGFMPPSSSKAISFSNISSGILFFMGGTQNFFSMYHFSVTSTNLMGKSVYQGTDVSYTSSGTTLNVTNRNTGNSLGIYAVMFYGNAPTMS